MPLLPNMIGWEFACAFVTLVFFIGDTMLPRGATPAIGYSLVPVLAQGSGRRSFALALTCICTILTWVGYFIEPNGAIWWMSVFDRGMVTGVLWLTLLLVWRCMGTRSSLALQARQLRDTVRDLSRSNSELENFASVVSHDIRGPLSSISLFAQLISMQPAVTSDANCCGHIESIQGEIRRMSQMIASLLRYSHAGCGGVQLSDCNCEEVLDSVRQSLEAELQNTGARITNAPLPTLQADPALMGQLLQNLVENGVKYRGKNVPLIHVSADRIASGWLFSVQDNGIGIRPEDCGHVFDAFYRCRDAQSLRGSGLGLATCKRIIERHGGRIDVESSLGNGSTFTFVFPDRPHMRTCAMAGNKNAQARMPTVQSKE